MIDDFLAAHGFARAERRPIAQDASTRRYWRLTDGPRAAVLMQAPDGGGELADFVRIDGHLRGIGISAPEILAADPARGLLLLEDLGPAMFGAAPAPWHALADAAIDALVVMQDAPPPSGLPDWDAGAMKRAALATFLDWWWPATFGAAAVSAAPAAADARSDFARALATMLAPLDAMPRVFVHRDFFADNLVWLPDRPGAARAGVLDFQSAARGSPAYDFVSFTQDARRDIPPDIEARARDRLLATRPSLDPAAFDAACAACAAARHLRVAGLWARLARRDGKPRYLAHGPRTWRLLDAALAHPACRPLADAMDRHVPRALRANPAALAA